MCCFLVPLAQAAATTAYRKRNADAVRASHSVKHEIPALEKMLWGGSVMLIVDHIVNGELMWRFPFFTALATEGGTGVFLHELVSVGLPMSAALTLVWAVYAVLKTRRRSVLA